MADIRSRSQRLDEITEEYRIEPDYDSTDPSYAYVGILGAVIDGERNAAQSAATLEELCEWFAGGFDNSNPREPVIAIDLDTGKTYRPVTRVTVTLEEGE